MNAFRNSCIAVEMIICAAGTAKIDASTGIGSRVISKKKKPTDTKTSFFLNHKKLFQTSLLR